MSSRVSNNATMCINRQCVVNENNVGRTKESVERHKYLRGSVLGLHLQNGWGVTLLYEKYFIVSHVILSHISLQIKWRFQPLKNGILPLYGVEGEEKIKEEASLYVVDQPFCTLSRLLRSGEAICHFICFLSDSKVMHHTAFSTYSFSFFIFFCVVPSV